MPDKMTTVQQILADPSLVPWIEERALAYAQHRFVMASRVLTLSDMRGWNTRKVSKVKGPKGASQLSEGVDIPTSKIFRKRLAEIDPEEWGDLYPVTNRRSSTDPEDVLAEVVSALGYSLGREREEKFFSTALSYANLILSAPTGAYTLDQAVQLQTEYEARAWDGQLYHVIHPFQELDVKLELLKLTNPANPDFRNRFIRQWSYGGFGGLNIAVSSMVPRKVLHRLVMSGALDTETFRLRVQLQDTADIAVGATVAATVINIQAALDALFSGSYTVSGTTYADISVQANVFVNKERELLPGEDDNGDVVDNVTGGITIQEESAVARAPFFLNVGIIHDVREPITVYQEWFPRRRTLEIGAYETYGVGPWDAEKIAYIETDATSPVAVP